MSNTDPFSTKDPQKIYAPPQESAEKIRHCPSCGEEMEFGDLRSSSLIRWVGNEKFSITKTKLGGDVIGKNKSIFGCKHPAYHCKHCKLFTLQP